MVEQEIKPFHFDLAETLYFHRNEGVSEMLGIGLDPEISIESHPDYVSVRGIIALTGEYLPTFVEDEREVEDPDEIQNRYFKRVERDEDGICDFLHHFPIDISIPHERIKNLADLTVSVDHFDYRVSDPRKLELEATVQIDGLEYDRNVEAEEEEIELIDEETDPIEDEIETDERIHFDVKLKEEESEQESAPPEEETPERDDEPAEIEEEAETIVHFEKHTEPILPKEEPEQEETRDVRQEIQDEEDGVEESRGDQSTYLLDLFDQSEEVNDVFAQMRMCIVQGDETLEEVAEKYQVSVTKIQRVNRLESTSIHQGQILYVPN